MSIPKYALGCFNSKALHSAFRKIDVSTWSLSDADLERKAKPTATDEKIKLRYWSLVTVSIETKKPLKIKRLHEGICTYTNLYNNILSNSTKLAWIMRPSMNFVDTINFAQSEALKQLYPIVTDSVVDKKGRINTKKAKLLLKALDLLLNMNGFG